MPNFREMIPGFLRTPFGIKAGGTTQMSMISLSEDELFAALNDSVFVNTMRNVSRAEFKDHLASTLRLGNMTDTSLHLPAASYIDAIHGALDYVYHERWGVRQDTRAATDMLVREVLKILPTIPQENIAAKAQVFRDITATPEEYAAQADEVAQRRIKGAEAGPFPGA